VAVVLFSYALPSESASSTLLEQQEAFQKVILFFSCYTLLVAVLVWFALPRTSMPYKQRNQFDGVREVLKLRSVWLQTLIVICAYVGYKISDNFSLYARDVLRYDPVQAAGIGTLAIWMRPFVAILAGFLGDRYTISKIILWGFSFMFIGSLFFAFNLIQLTVFWMFVGSIITLSLGIYSVRGLYYAIMEEGKIPIMYTGTAVGIISVLGYTPDVFMGPLMGVLLDSNPGIRGHQHVFMVLTCFSLIGLLATLIFRRWNKSESGSFFDQANTL
jgi:nitrate/nitrite transporter NarK